MIEAFFCGGKLFFKKKLSHFIFVPMAYNNNNRFLRIKEIQDVFLLHKTDGNTTRYVYKNYIFPKYKISISAFYNYMGINVRKELKQLDLFPEPTSLTA